jgi:hypothetical protein
MSVKLGYTLGNTAYLVPSQLIKRLQVLSWKAAKYQGEIGGVKSSISGGNSLFEYFVDKCAMEKLKKLS